MNNDSEACREFSERLRRLMAAKGYTSERNRSGVDVSALSGGAGVSYEMARRYVEGYAMPRPDAMKAIARWLGVEPAALAYGRLKLGPNDVDAVLLEECLRAVTDAQAEAGVALPADKAARLVAQLYSEAIKGSKPSQSSLSAMLRAVFK